MHGGRMSGRVSGARVTSLLGSLLWVVTLLSVLQWSTAAAFSAPGTAVLASPFTTTLASPDADTSGPVAYAQLPAPPALAEKRGALSAGSPKIDPDDVAIGGTAPVPSARTTPAHPAPPASALDRPAESTDLPPARGPPSRA